MASAPTLHTFDPLIAGKIGLRIDAPATGIDLVIWKTSTKTGGPYGQAGTTNVITGFDGLYFIVDADSTLRYWIAQAHDSAGYSPVSNEVSTSASAGPPPPPPPLTDVQMVEQALGVTLNSGDKVEVYPATPTTVQTVNADNTIS